MGAKRTKKANKAINLNDCLVLNKYFLSLYDKRDFRELAEDMRSADLEGYNEENTSYFHEFIVRKYVKLGFLNKDKLKEYDENIFRYVQHIGEGRGGLTLKYFQYLALLFTKSKSGLAAALFTIAPLLILDFIFSTNPKYK